MIPDNRDQAITDSINNHTLTWHNQSEQKRENEAIPDPDPDRIQLQGVDRGRIQDQVDRDQGNQYLI